MGRIRQKAKASRLDPSEGVIMNDWGHRAHWHRASLGGRPGINNEKIARAMSISKNSVRRFDGGPIRPALSKETRRCA